MVGTSGESKETGKGKRPYISSITGGVIRLTLPFKGTMKRKIAEMMVVYHKEGNTSTKIPDRPMLGFWDLENFGGIPNESFPIVIIATIGKFDISQILTDGGSSYDIMYSELFEKMNLNRSNLLPYECSYL